MSENYGKLLVRTETSVYKIDFDENKVVRNPQEGLELPDDVILSELRKDDEAIDLISIQEIVLGEPMIMVLDIRKDGIPTLRHTTYVTEITHL